MYTRPSITSFLVAAAAAALLPACADGLPRSEPGDVADIAESAESALNLDPCALANPMDIRVPAQCPTLTAAVARISNGGTIRLSAGDYTENVSVTNKAVNILGAGMDTTRIIGASAQTPAILLGGIASASISAVTIRGGSAGIEARSVLGIKSQGLTVSNVRFTATPYGVLGDFLGSVFIGQSTIQGTTRGIQLRSVGDLDVIQSTVMGGGQGGLFVNAPTATAGCLIYLDGVQQSLSGSIGAVFTGRGCPVTIRNSSFNLNNHAGLYFDQSGNADVGSTHIGYAYPTADGRYGDGILDSGTVLRVHDSVIEDASRAGVSVFGCSAAAPGTNPASVALANTRIDRAGFDIDVERAIVHPTSSAACPAGSTSPGLSDLGGNVCNGAECHAESSILAPLAL